MMKLVLRPAEHSDLCAIADVHQQAFPRFFLTRMGPGFLSAYYRLVLDYPGGILFVVDTGAGIEGFVAGFVDPSTFYVYMAGMKRRLFWSALTALLRRPALLPRALYNRRKVELSRGTAKPHLSELSSIAVLPGAAGRGHGAKLVGVFCEEARRRGCVQVVLATDADDNEAVNAFYLRCGFTLERTELSGRSRRMNTYVQHLESIVQRPRDQVE